jgi:hypothetical protein
LRQEEGDEDDGFPVPWVEGEGGGGDDTIDVDQGNDIALRGEPRPFKDAFDETMDLLHRYLFLLRFLLYHHHPLSSLFCCCCYCSSSSCSCC